MEINNLIPTPDTIPSPARVFIFLEQFTFLAHIIIINALLGGIFLVLINRFVRIYSGDASGALKSLSAKLPVLIALGINLGVAPLLFLQVVYGNLYYSSSVLMAVWWIVIIPVLIAAYYGLYIYAEKAESLRRLSMFSLIMSAGLILYVAFVQVSNNSLMERPDTWGAYFNGRGGLLLNLSMPVFIPRFLHFFFASLAIGGLFAAVLSWFKKRKGVEGSERQIRESLRIFGVCSSLQAAAGAWYLMAIPVGIRAAFMGQDFLSTTVLSAGILWGLAAIISSFRGSLAWTACPLFIAMIFMIISRYQVRILYLAGDFSTGDLKVVPQYGILALFLAVLVTGLVSVAYMIKVSILSENRNDL
jgi:hypothetical protein